MRLAAALSLGALASGCSTLGYYAHLFGGEYELLSLRRPISEVLIDPQVDGKTKARLALAQQARSFASEHLDLPDNGSYTLYADLHRPYAVWNVFAAPEFSLAPVQHCFPVAGCVAYRGFYDRERAQAEADRLKAEGDDTLVSGISAYSTLGWFDDPILNTMLRWNDDHLAATLFHELTHQKLYVKGDTEFNESLATFVEQEGLRQWLELRQAGPNLDEALSAQREQQFTDLVLAARQRLEALYAHPLAPDDMRRAKAAEIERLRADYRTLRDGDWHGYDGYDAWMQSDINNAKLLPFALYHSWVSAFATLYAQQGRDWHAFFGAAQALAKQPRAQRHGSLERLGEARG